LRDNDSEPCSGYERDDGMPEWHGFHAARRGLGSNLYRLGVPSLVIQKILRHSNVSATESYYIKSNTADVLEAMQKFEDSLRATHRPPEHSSEEQPGFVN
jgi:integrase